MRHLYAALCVVALTAAPVLAQDTTPVERPSSEARVPNAVGATGLLLSPTAYVQENAAITPFIFGENRFIGGGAVVGIADRLEVGATILGGRRGFAGGDTKVLGNAKFNFLAEKRDRPALSVGVVDAWDSLNIGPSWYVVASKYFTRSATEQKFALKGSVGYGGGIYDEEVFAGAELVFNGSLSAMAEYVNGNFNVGGRWVKGGFAATIGLFDLDTLGGGVSYTFRFR